MAKCRTGENLNTGILIVKAIVFLLAVTYHDGRKMLDLCMRAGIKKKKGVKVMELNIETSLGVLLVLFLIFLFFETKRRSDMLVKIIKHEKATIARDSQMTAHKIDVFNPDINTTVILGASEDFGALYYRMIQQRKLINSSKFNLANIVGAELHINGFPKVLDMDSSQPSSSLRAQELAGKFISSSNPEELKNIQKAVVKISYASDDGDRKNLELTVFRSDIERQRMNRMQLLKAAAWWTVFLNISSRQARHVRSRMDIDPAEEAANNIG